MIRIVTFSQGIRNIGDTGPVWSPAGGNSVSFTGGNLSDLPSRHINCKQLSEGITDPTSEVVTITYAVYDPHIRAVIFINLSYECELVRVW